MTAWAWAVVAFVPCFALICGWSLWDQKRQNEKHRKLMDEIYAEQRRKLDRICDQSQRNMHAALKDGTTTLSAESRRMAEAQRLGTSAREQMSRWSRWNRPER